MVDKEVTLSIVIYVDVLKSAISIHLHICILLHFQYIYIYAVGELY